MKATIETYIQALRSGAKDISFETFIKSNESVKENFNDLISLEDTLHPMICVGESPRNTCILNHDSLMKLGYKEKTRRDGRSVVNGYFMPNAVYQRIKGALYSQSTAAVVMAMQSKMVGMTGFEPATPSPPDWCANRAALHPDRCKNY